MSMLFVGVIRMNDGMIEFCLSEHVNKNDAIDKWEEDEEVELIRVIEVPVSRDPVTLAVVRALASTPEGQDLFVTLFGAIVQKD